MQTHTEQETRNIEIVRRGYEAFAKGDMETLQTLIARDARWHEAPAGVFSGDYRGAPAIMEYFARLAQETGGTFRVTLDATAATGNRVFALSHVSAQRKGKTYDGESVNVFTIEDGRATEVTLFDSNHPELAAFFS